MRAGTAARRSNPDLLACIPVYSSRPKIHAAHAHAHTDTHTLPPSAARTFLISLWPLLMADAFCSLLFPFSLSLSAPPFPFSISSFFLSAAHAVGFSSQPPPSPLSLSLPPSLAPFPSLSRSLSLHLPSLSLSLNVCRARGHYLSHSGHVRWNGGVCSEQKQRGLWGGGRVASGGSLGNSTVQQSSYQ